MAFFMGLAGGAAVAALLLSGTILGWQLARHQARPRAEALSEGEDRRLREEQEAFRLLQNYTVERAYGGKEA